MDFLMNLVRSLPVLKKYRSPTASAFWGFILGGIGLGLYFGSLLDFIFPILAIIVLASVLKVGGWLVGAALVGLYGYIRASASNARIAQREAAAKAKEVP